MRRYLGWFLIALGAVGSAGSGFITWQRLTPARTVAAATLAAPANKPAAAVTPTRTQQHAAPQSAPSAKPQPASPHQTTPARQPPPAAPPTPQQPAPPPPRMPAPRADTASTLAESPQRPAQRPATAVLREFWFDYTFEPAGRRTWKQTDSLTWIQKLPTGEQELMNTNGALKLGDVPGVVIRSADDAAGHLEYFVPDAGVHHKLARWIRFRIDQGAWQYLAELHEGAGR